MTELSPKTQQYRRLALFSYLSLVVWVVLWHSVIAPHSQINPLGLTVAWLIPLLFPLPGILRGKAYTHAWANFILMFYFLHALTMIWVDEGERFLALVELIIVSAAFAGNTLYAKFRGQELGLKLPKLSTVEKQEKEKFDQSSSD